MTTQGSNVCKLRAFEPYFFVAFCSVILWYNSGELYDKDLIMFFGLFGKKKQQDMPAAPMNDTASMNTGASMQSSTPPMSAPETKPMGDMSAPAGAMPDPSQGEGDGAM